jgi:hypothetical protein
LVLLVHLCSASGLHRERNPLSRTPAIAPPIVTNFWQEFLNFDAADGANLASVCARETWLLQLVWVTTDLSDSLRSSQPQPQGWGFSFLA